MDKQLNGYELLSRSKAAKMMRISQSTLNTLINAGKIGVLEMGKREKIPVMEIQRYMKENLIREKRKMLSFNSSSTAEFLTKPKSTRSSMHGDKILNQLLQVELKDGYSY